MRSTSRFERLLFGWTLLASGYVLAIVLTKSDHTTLAQAVLATVILNAIILTTASIRWFMQATHALSLRLETEQELAASDDAVDALPEVPDVP